MNRSGMAVLAALLAGCAGGGTQEVSMPARAVQEQACAAAVAAHVGKGLDAVAATWTGLTATGTAIVAVSDQQGPATERVHTCEVDAAGQVLALRHTGR